MSEGQAASYTNKVHASHCSASSILDPLELLARAEVLSLPPFRNPSGPHSIPFLEPPAIPKVSIVPFLESLGIHRFPIP